MKLTARQIRQWAQRQTLASAKLEGRGLPPGYVRSAAVQQFLQRRINVPRERPRNSTGDL